MSEGQDSGEGRGDSVTDEPVATDEDSTSNDASSSNRRRILAWVAAAVVLGLIVAAVVWGVTRGGADPEPSTPTATTTSAADSPEATPGQTDSPTTTDPTETAPPPSDGTEPPARESAAPVPIGEDAEVTADLVARVSKVDPVQGQAVLPGEVSGPALSVTVEIDNRTTSNIDLTSAVVTMYYGADGLGANPISQPAGQAFPSVVDAGRTATGVFVFEVPNDQRDNIRIEVDLSVGDPIVVFEGSAATS